MLDALDALPPGQVTVELCEPPTLARLEEMIAEARKEKRPFHIVHFDGHGGFDEGRGIGDLAFERSETNSRMHPVTGIELGELLARLEVRLVLLEACRSSALSDRPAIGSVAPALVANGVESVIAFSHNVHVKASRLLVERFYRALVAGQTVGQALVQARTGLRDDPQRWLHLGPDADSINLEDWFIPQLYQLGPDLALIVACDASRTAAAQSPLRAAISNRPPRSFRRPSPEKSEFDARKPCRITSYIG
ncbi:MAG: CHAT domain-containing protein [bacterium]|nr:CHAT domain-containing protein [bacterium]